jgi:amino acid transporter/nucleotide-binding universal stress UspA family protein
VLEELFLVAGAVPPAWIDGRFALLLYALAALAFYAWGLVRSPTSGGLVTTIGKLVVFGALIVGGLGALLLDPPSGAELGERFSPFFEQGASGLAQAMGYTFITVQGFALIALVGGKVERPERNIPRAMALSVAIALAIYLPLLFLIVAVGTEGESVVAAASADPEMLVATSARVFLGPAGYWLVIAAGILSMLSALRANLMAAASLADTMAANRTFPVPFDAGAGGGRSPVAAIKITALTVAFVLFAGPDVAVAGAVASLIFLATFALVHGIAYLVRRRAHEPGPFRAPFFPTLPIAGGALCLALALYQAAAVPSAGVLAALWLGVGAILYVTHLAPGARSVDASSEELDPRIIRYRGRSPLVLVPMANPDNAALLVKIAEAIAPRGVSRTQLLSVVRPSPPSSDATLDPALDPALVDAQRVLAAALSAAVAVDLRPETLVTFHDDPWKEIARIAERSRCDKILFGVGDLATSLMSGPLEALVGRVDADVVIVRAPAHWNPDNARRILVPSRGGRAQSPIRARLLGSLIREAPREVTYLGVLPESTSTDTLGDAERELKALARDEARRSGSAEVLRGGDLVAEVVQRSADCDLMILGLRRGGRRSVFGGPMVRIAEATTCPLMMISQRS